MKDDNEIKEQVREAYGRIISHGHGGCASSSGCCGNSAPEATARNLGYSREDLEQAPPGANLGLGCGNPQAIAELQPGEVVLDLGAGAGFDCFLAARQVGDKGRVIGVDMTPALLAKARKNAEQSHMDNVEFRLGEIEHLPLADASVDVVMSNCVINLSPDKDQVYREAFRVLRSRGRIAISDTVRIADLPEQWKHDPSLYCGCIAGAATPGQIEKMLRDAGFQDVNVKTKPETREIIKHWAPGSGAEKVIVSAEIRAIKP